jgi:TetR/AcrR family transcriptional regulator
VSEATLPPPSWAERAAERSPVVQRSRAKGVQQARVIVEAARRLILLKGTGFTTQELVKEAGIALQTFYRYFEGKDQLLLAVIDDLVSEACAAYRDASRDLEDPVRRLRLYVTSVVRSLANEDGGPAGPRFITTEHWRLQALYPQGVSDATKPFTELLLGEIRAAVEAGQLTTQDPAYHAWLVTQLLMTVYHHYAFAVAEESYDAIADRLWDFCLAALGGR